MPDKGPVREMVDIYHWSLTNLENRSHRRVWTNYVPAVSAGATLIAAQMLFGEHLDIAGAGRTLLTATALLTGVLFGTGVTLLGRAADMDSPDTVQGAATSRSALRLQALSASVLLSVLLSGAATATLLVGALAPPVACPATIIAAVLLVQVGANGFIVVGRVFRDTQWRANRARAGLSSAG